MRRVAGGFALLVALAAAGLCVRLGLWQLGRWQEKRELAARQEERLRAPATELRSTGALTASLAGRRVSAVGVYEDSAYILMAGRIEQGEPGVGLVSVMALEQGGRLLVDRGWIPALDARDADPAPFREPGPRTVLGVLEPIPDAPRDAQWLRLAGGSPVRWSVGRLTRSGVQSHLGGAVATFRLVALPEPSGPVLPRRDAPEAPDAFMHLSYALQWFLFAAGTLGAAIFLSLRGRDRRQPPRPGGD